jgi:hypothetical protein
LSDETWTLKKKNQVNLVEHLKPELIFQVRPLFIFNQSIKSNSKSKLILILKKLNLWKQITNKNTQVLEITWVILKISGKFYRKKYKKISNPQSNKY